jgi:hypothetical protein
MEPPDELETLLETYKERFPNHNAFRLIPGNPLRRAIKDAKVPNEPGVYLIYGFLAESLSLLYIGMSGKQNSDGTFKVQGIRDRLKGKQGREPRSEFFPRKLHEMGFDMLLFRWFVTYSPVYEVSVSPRDAELELMRQYVAQYCRIPEWNNYP